MTSSVYLDFAASTPMSKAVCERMKTLVDRDAFGNSTATHHVEGARARDLVEESRGQIAASLGVTGEQVLFFGGASEANNSVVYGFWNRFKDRGARVLYSAIEHKSLFEPCIHIGKLPNGFSEEISVDAKGQLDLSLLEKLLADNPHKYPTLVVAMGANNEIPVKQDLNAISVLCRKYKAYLHSDCVQLVVRERLDLSSDPWGSIVISSHKFYGPKGVGILVEGLGRLSPRLDPMYRGGEQERGFRPGTLNSLAIAASGLALTEHFKEIDSLRETLLVSDKHFVDYMKAHLPRFHLTVPFTTALPGIVNFYIDGQDAQSLLNALPHICINRGASCTGGGGEKYSHVPRALGLPVEIQANVLRASFGKSTTKEQIEYACKEIMRVVHNQISG